MKNISKLLFLIGTFLTLSLSASAQEHVMQHGFIISDDDEYFSHLVATGHHSHQLSLLGKLTIKDMSEEALYLKRKKLNITEKSSYFFFQAQELSLPHTRNGQVLRGHIVESPVGGYTPKNIIVKEATLKVDKVLLNVVNPFFLE